MGLYGSTSDQDKLSLVIRRGAYSIEYHVYYKERGEKHSLKIFTDENVACTYFLKKFKDSKEIEDSIG
jgi:hypothetical protein